MSTQRKTYGNPTRAKPSEEPSSATYQFRPWSQLKEQVQKKTCASSGATIIREDDTDPSEEEDAIMEFVKDVSSILVCVGLSQAVAYPLGLDGSAALAMVVQFVVWAPSAWIRNERFFDFTGMATFILLATRSQAICKRRFFGDDGRWWGFFKEAPRHTIATALVLIWTLRFKHVRGRPIRFLLYFSVQGMWVFLTPLPMFALHNLDPKGDGDMGALNAGDVVGLAVWIAGFALEVIADNQKKSFKMNPANKGKFIDVGLWARCRHPNYLGEMVTWAGFFLLCRRGLLQGSGWAILAGPAFVVTVILFLSTPMLEEGADRKFGGQAAYQEYKRRAPCLLFRIW